MSNVTVKPAKAVVIVCAVSQKGHKCVELVQSQSRLSLRGPWVFVDVTFFVVTPNKSCSRSSPNLEAPLDHPLNNQSQCFINYFNWNHVCVEQLAECIMSYR